MWGLGEGGDGCGGCHRSVDGRSVVGHGIEMVEDHGDDCDVVMATVMFH